MLTVLNIDKASPIDITAFTPAAKADYVCVDTAEKNGGREAVYQLTDGDEEFPATQRIGWYPNPKFAQGDGQTNVSSKFSTFAQKTDGDGNVLWTKPLTVTVAVSCPGVGGLPAEADLIAAIEHCVSWLVPHTLGEPSDQALAELKFGVVNVLNGHVDS